MFAISPLAETTIFATYKRQQTMLERQRRLNFLPVILFQDTTTCNSSIVGLSKKTWGLGRDDLKTMKDLLQATGINAE